MSNPELAPCSSEGSVRACRGAPGRLSRRSDQPRCVCAIRLDGALACAAGVGMLKNGNVEARPSASLRDGGSNDRQQSTGAVDRRAVGAGQPGYPGGGQPRARGGDIPAAYGPLSPDADFVRAEQDQSRSGAGRHRQAENNDRGYHDHQVGDAAGEGIPARRANGRPGYEKRAAAVPPRCERSRAAARTPWCFRVGA